MDWTAEPVPVRLDVLRTARDLHPGLEDNEIAIAAYEDPAFTPRFEELGHVYVRRYRDTSSTEPWVTALQSMAPDDTPELACPSEARARVQALIIEWVLAGEARLRGGPGRPAGFAGADSRGHVLGGLRARGE